MSIKKMNTPTVILLLFLSLNREILSDYVSFKYSRSVETRPLSTSSPCPSVFQYQMENGDLVGTVSVQPFEHNGMIQLDVELSVGNSVQGYNGKIILADSRDKVLDDVLHQKSIFYKILFPLWRNIPPKIVKISINGNLICNGPAIPIQLVPVLTTINLQHKLYVGTIPLSVSSVDNNLAPRYDENPFLNNKNPFDFNPGPPPNMPHQHTTLAPQLAPQSPPPQESSGNFQWNPFLTGLSTTQPPRSDNQFEGNPFLNFRTSEKPITTTQPPIPPRRGGPDGEIANIENACGRPTKSLIFSGQTFSAGAYPWMVALFHQFGNSNVEYNIKYMCGGTLVSQRHVVTAAHCVMLENGRLKPNELLCAFGKQNLKDALFSSKGKTLWPESITIHPDYEATSTADIAVLTFAESIQFNHLISPICLWSGSADLNLVIGKEGIVVGWGRKENGEIDIAVPKQISVPIVSQESCLRSAGGAFLPVTSNTTFCAGRRDGTGPCDGDSGSGFFIARDGVFYLRGIVSRALSHENNSKCNLQEYVIFTDVSKYMNWLKSIVR